MKIQPFFKFDDYEPTGKLYIKNMLQAIRYWIHGAHLYDLIPDDDGDRWTWVFDAKETSELFDRWCRRELPPKQTHE